MKKKYPHLPAFVLTSLMTIFSSSFSLQAQTTIFSENFESGTSTQFLLNTADVNSTTSGINDWVINNAYTGGSGSFTCMGFPFSFTVPNNGAQPTGIINSPNSYYLHLNSDAAAASGVNSSCFIAADGLCSFPENNFTKTIPISTLGYTAVSLSFWWACGGEQGNIYGEVYYTTDGTTWNLITTPISMYHGQSGWTQQTISLAAFDNQPTLQIGFRFTNNLSSAASDPPFQLDDIMITGCTVSTATISPSICLGSSYISPSGNYSWTNAGTYADTIPSATGCDSIITINLNVNSVDATVSNTSPLLTANATGAQYQWLDCSNNFAIITGESNQSYNAASNGNYAVSVTQNGCTDTSSCEAVINLELNENSFDSNLSVYPNPTTGNLFINLGNSYGRMSVIVNNTLGQTVINKNINASGSYELFLDVPEGMYIIELNDSGERKARFKVIKN